MAAIVVKAFNGMKPIADPVLLDVPDAQVANNVLLTSGAIRPLKDMTEVTPPPLHKFAPKTIYRFDPENNQLEDSYWFEFDLDTDVMRSPIAQDQWDRVYWTNGANEPRYAPAAMAITKAGDGSMPGASWILGVPKPGTKPVVTDFTEAQNITTGTRTYCLTFWDGTKESPPGLPWNVQAVDGKDVVLTNITTDNRGNTAVTEKRLYRKVPDASPATTKTFRRIASIPLDEAEYTDKTTDADAVGLPPLPLNNAPRAPQYPPVVGAVNLPEGTSNVLVNRFYCYTLADGVHGGEGYHQSRPSDEVSIMAGDANTVTVSGLINVATEAQKFRIYRKIEGQPTMLLVSEQSVDVTSFVDAVKQPALPMDRSDTSTKPPPPTLTLGTPSAGPGTVKRVYMVTYVDGNGNESPKSPDSEVVEVVDGVTEVELVHSEPLPTGVTKKRLYRQDIVVTSGIISTNDANWRFVAENTASGTRAIDKVATADLPGTGYPPALQGLPPSPVGTPTTKATIPPSVVPESRVYCYTFVTAYDEEGPPSDSSEVASVDPAFPVTVSVPSGPPTGAYNITKKRIYRSATGTQRTKFQYVGECPVGVMSFVDDVKTSALSELLETEGWIPPPKGLQGLRMMANGCAVGFVGNSVYFSEPNLPHAWPHEYPIDDQIIGIGTFGQSVAVLTRGYPYLFTGIDPGAMASNKLQMPQACVSKRTIVEMGDGVMYASPDGLTSIGANTSLITANILSRDQWRAYMPETMECFVCNGKILVTYDISGQRGTLLFDLSGAGALLSTSDINTTDRISAGHYAPEYDILYFSQGMKLMRFDNGGPMLSVWRSKVFRLPQEVNFGFAKVLAESYVPQPILYVYADGFEIWTQVVDGPKQFRLPSGFVETDWSFEVHAGVKITEVCLAQSTVELQAS